MYFHFYSNKFSFVEGLDRCIYAFAGESVTAIQGSVHANIIPDMTLSVRENFPYLRQQCIAQRGNQQEEIISQKSTFIKKDSVFYC